MRYFRKPEALIIVRDDGSRTPISFDAFTEGTLTADQKLGTSMSALRSSMKVVAAVEKVADGQIVALEDADWEAIKATIEAPSVPYLPRIARQVWPFFDAFLSASSASPVDA